MYFLEYCQQSNLFSVPSKGEFWGGRQNASGSDGETKTDYITVEEAPPGLTFESGTVAGVGSSWEAVSLPPLSVLSVQPPLTVVTADGPYFTVRRR